MDGFYNVMAKNGNLIRANMTWGEAMEYARDYVNFFSEIVRIECRATRTVTIVRPGTNNG